MKVGDIIKHIASGELAAIGYEFKNMRGETVLTLSYGNNSSQDLMRDFVDNTYTVIQEPK